LRRLWLTPSLVMTFSLKLQKWNSKHADSRVNKKAVKLNGKLTFTQ
jgi:hypothetical protein